MKFLHSKLDVADENHFLKSIAGVLAKGDEIDLAVAYWGLGAVKALGIDGSKKTRILCDLMSAGCNPYEIEQLLRPPFKDKVEVRHLGGLHAKVYRTPGIVIVGSANASMNGLGTEATIGTIEAAIETDSADVLADVKIWFNQLWEDRAIAVDSNLIAESIAVPRGPRTSTTAATFVDLLLDGRPLLRKRLTLVHIRDSASLKSIRTFKKQASSNYTKAQIEGLADDELPFYQAGRSKAEIDRKCQPGDYIFNCAGQELSRIREPGTIKLDENDCIILLDDHRKHLLVYDKARSEIIKTVSLTGDDKLIMKRTTKRFLALNSEFFEEEGRYAEDMPDEFFRMMQEERDRVNAKRRARAE